MGFVLRRLATAIPVVIGITIIAFLLIHLVPGDPAKIILFGTDATPAQLANLRRQLGLDQPLWQQYVGFIGQLLHGNLGTSYLTQNSVAHEILSRTPRHPGADRCAAVLVAIVVGVPLGMVGGVFPGSLARPGGQGGVVPWRRGPLLLPRAAARADASACGCICCPRSATGRFSGLILPAVSLGWGYAAILTRLVRGRLIEEYRSEYVKSARARGCTEWRVLLRHALRNSSIPAITTIGLQFGNILTGAAVTEVIFGRPGLGSFLATAISNKNIPVVQGAIVVIGIGYVMINLIIDLIVGAVDPRTRRPGLA